MATIAENIQTLRSIKSDIKQAITNKGGSVGNDFKTYAQAITNLPSGGGGGTDIEDALIMKTISVYSNDRLSMIGDYAFYMCSALKSVDLQLCMSVNSHAFAYCKLLESVSLPNCLYLGSSALYYCNLISSISLPKCTYVDGWALYNCTKLQSIDLPLCEYLGSRAFYGCSILAQVYLNSVSSVTTIDSTTFSKCPNLTSIYVPASLVYEFKTAQYWSNISNKIVAYTGA